LNTLLHGIIWMAIFPLWFLSKSGAIPDDYHANCPSEMLPFDVHRKLVKSYFECADYFKELSEYKVEQLKNGEKAEEGTMDLMGI
jgi:hypothetical protein